MSEIRWKYKDGSDAQPGDVFVLDGVDRAMYIYVSDPEGGILFNDRHFKWTHVHMQESFFKRYAIKKGTMPSLYNILKEHYDMDV